MSQLFKSVLKKKESSLIIKYKTIVQANKTIKESLIIGTKLH